MFPEETHQKIVKRIDEIEVEMFEIYRRLERLRLDLQEQWRVLPSGARWTQEKKDA
jgi:Txe/YoeB family toxin of Txe-Axe toxin-antitoxin module